MIMTAETSIITYTGTLAVGATISFDTNDHTVVKTGVNAIDGFDGEFVWMYPGTNQLVYTDTESSRSVRIVVTKKDRTA